MLTTITITWRIGSHVNDSYLPGPHGSVGSLRKW